MQNQQQNQQQDPIETDLQVKPEYILPSEPSQPQTRQRGTNNWTGCKFDFHPQICNSYYNGVKCNRPDCKKFHSPEEYLNSKYYIKYNIPCYNQKTYNYCEYLDNCLYTHDPQLIFDIEKHKLLQKEINQKKFIRNSTPFIPKSSKESEMNFYPQDHFNSTNVKRLMLAPMCTVATLPFRRLCVDFGCDVTSSEMIFCKDLVKRSPMEMAKLRRHPTEKLFSIQITGQANDLKAAIPIIEKNTTFDCLELNAGCPQEIACQSGLGYRLEEKRRVNGCLKAIRSVYDGFLSLKTRCADFQGQNRLNQIVNEDIADIDIQQIVLHGRSAAQRYSKYADWKQVEELQKMLQIQQREIKVVGNGDVYLPGQSYPCDTIMIGRGALIKPWIFKEIKEGKQMDLNSTERMKIYEKFRDYLLDYYGTDFLGVEKAREQFLQNWEWLSRYVAPSLLINQDTQALNMRMPRIKGRDDMETLMAAQNAASYVKVSEYLFGEVPAGFKYQTKHKNTGVYYKDEQIN